MSLSVENAVILERAIARARAFVEADPILRRSMPSLETFQHVVDCPTSIEIVQRAVETYAERPAIGYRKHELVRDPATGKRVASPLPAFETISYRHLWARVELLASGLGRSGVGAGDLVSLVGFSTVDHLVAELACHYLAAVSVPFAKNVDPRELEQIIAQCQSTTLFCNVEQLLPVAQSMRACPSVARLIVIDLLEGDDAQLELVAEARAAAAAARPELEVMTIRDVETLGARTGRIPPVIPAEGTDPLLSLVYTSGSTGAPKGAMFGERSWHSRWSTLPFLELTSLPMVSVVFLPQNHMGGRNAIANSLKIGGLAYLTHRSDLSTLFEDIRIVRPTYLHLVPRLSEMIYQHFQSEVARRGPGSPQAVMAEMRGTFLGDRMLLALTASAPTPPEVLAFVKSCFDVPVVNVFAGTEYGQLFIDGTLNRQNVLELKLASVPELGYLESDQPYPRGELLVKTARGISSYFKNEQATSELFDDSGFMRTGDIFERRGPDEMVWIDRKNNVLKLAQGEFVNLWRLEGLLAAGSRCIQQIYLQGDSLRSYLLAVVVPELSEVPGIDPASPEPGAVKAVLRAELHRLAKAHGLAPYEIPRDFLVELDPFSRDNGLLTSLGKPARPKLKLKYGPALDRMYEELENRRASGLSSLARDARDDHDGRDGRDGPLPIAVALRRTFAAALGLSEPALDLSRSFRELGGDSIAAANLRILIQREWDVRLSASALLGPDASLAEVLAKLQAGIQAETHAPPDHRARAAATVNQIHGPIHGANPGAIYARDLRLERFFERPLVQGTLVQGSGPVGQQFLLTGATGFLGRFLCCSLLERAAKIGGQVTCIVRARSDAEAFQRLADVYGAGSPLQQRFHTLAAEHLRVLAGDLEEACFGWPQERHARLADRVDTVLHAAALVNHALPYAQLFEANVLGTAEVLRFCLSGRPKRFNFVSTNSVSLALLGDREAALETDDTRALGDGWPTRAGHAGGYRISKWAGEVLAQDLFETYGVPVNVFRCNLILPPASCRGQINAADFFTRLVCSVVHAGLYPESFYERPQDPAARPHLDGLPADFIAEAIVAIAAGAAIAANGSPGHAVYHINNVHWNDGVSLDSVMRRLEALGYPVSRVADHATWFQQLERALRALDAARQAASSLPILEQWRAPLETAKRRRIDASGFRAQVQALRPQGLADIPHLDDAYFDRCIEDMQRLGLIPSP